MMANCSPFYATDNYKSNIEYFQVLFYFHGMKSVPYRLSSSKVQRTPSSIHYSLLEWASLLSLPIRCD